MPPKKIYCGDKKELPAGYHKKGTRLICLQRGIGMGMFLEEKEEKKGKTLFKERKEPEAKRDKRKEIYCGYKDVVPNTHKRMGTRFKCFKKGVGVGITLKFKEDKKSLLNRIRRGSVKSSKKKSSKKKRKSSEKKRKSSAKSSTKKRKSSTKKRKSSTKKKSKKKSKRRR